MNALVAPSNWQHPQKLRHWLKHTLLPLICVVGFLLLPKPWSTHKQGNRSTVIEIELTKNENKPETKPVIKPETETETETKPQNTPTESPTELKKQQFTKTKPVNTLLKKQEQNTPPAKPKTTVAKQKVNSGVIMHSAKNRTSILVSPEFQARSGVQKNFSIPTLEIEDWFADIPYLDESVDRPKIQMKFYAEGIEGSVEKFFDKITISKTFTTRYGTKIHCALIGVLAACGWK